MPQNQKSDWRSVLWAEHMADEDSFTFQLRCGPGWNKEAYLRLFMAMIECCKAHEGKTYIERWIADTFYWLDFYPRQGAEDEKKIGEFDYYSNATVNFNHLIHWLFTGESRRDDEFEPLRCSLTMNEQLEEEVITLFIAPDKKERYLFALPRLKHRYAALIKLFANTEIDFRFAVADKDVVALSQPFSSEKELCYVLSCNEAIDGKEMRFEDAKNSDSILGILLYFPKSKTAYFQSEDGGEYWLDKS